MKTLETAQSSCLNGTSNLRASWPKKISLWVSYDSNTTSAVPHAAFFSVKRDSCFVVQAFVPLGYCCLSDLTATKCSLAFQRLQWTKNAPSGPAPSWKLSLIVSFDSYLATSLTKFDVRFCRVDPRVEVDGWRVHMYLLVSILQRWHFSCCTWF